MSKTTPRSKFKICFVYPDFKNIGIKASFLIIISLALLLTIFEGRYALTSFKLCTGKDIMMLRFYRPDKTICDPVVNKDVFLPNKIFSNSGYSISFYLKTKIENTLLFYTASSRGGGSVYWNISLVDGKIETYRLDKAPPFMGFQKINDDMWHHVYISNDSTQKIYVDGELINLQVSSKNHYPDKWMQFVTELNDKSPRGISYKNIVFVNKAFDLTKTKAFFDSGFRILTIDLLKSLLFYLSTITFSLFLISLYVKAKYFSYPFVEIFNRVSVFAGVFCFFAIFLWTDYWMKVLILCFYLFFYFINNFYGRCFPKYLKSIFTPIYFLSLALKLIVQKKIDQLPSLFRRQKPSFYLFLFIFLNFLILFE